MNRPHVFYRVIAFSVAAALLTGCTNSDSDYDATVQGTVTIDGELASRGSVTFHPVKRGPTAYATIQQDGSFALRTGQGPVGAVDGGKVKSGEYVVTVVVTGPAADKQQVGDTGPPVPGPRITAAKYARKKTSDLKFKVTAGTNVIPLELERASDEEAAETAEEGDEAGSEKKPADAPASPPATDEATSEPRTTNEADAAAPIDEPAAEPAATSPSESAAPVETTTPEPPAGDETLTQPAEDAKS